MALKPRFRVAALDRRFVDRADALAAFAGQLEQIGDHPRVFNVTGVGGIGKSRLLRELRDGAAARGFRTAMLDLQVPALRQHEDALAVLRREFGSQGVNFSRFDIAYAVLWQRLHPHLKFSDADLPFATESEILSDILDEAAGVPVFGTALGLIKLADRAASKLRRTRRVKVDATLQRLDQLTNTEVVDAVTFLFAGDLRAASDWRRGKRDCGPFVVFVDAYEALVPSPVRAGRVGAADVWLRDLVSQLNLGVVVIASREPLAWEAYDPEWGEVIDLCPVGGLPMEARCELLSEVGIAESVDQRAIAHASEGLPFYLHLAADTMPHEADTLVVSSEEILQRFLLHVAPGEIRLLELLSVARTFDFEIFRTLAEAFDLPGDRMTWESIAAYSFIYPNLGTGLRLHQLMAKALRDRLSIQVALDAHRVLRKVWDERVDEPTSAGLAVVAIREAVYHGIWSGMRADDVLAYADRAIRDGGTQASSGMVIDLHELLASESDPQLTEAALCLEAEATVRLGDAARARELTPLDDLPPPTSSAGARIGIAAAHARRIGGATAEAGRIYSQVWKGNQGHAALVGGLWVADVDMWQGRFATAFDRAQRVLEISRPDDHLLRGDTLRLMHLGYRFHLNLAKSKQAFEDAHRAYDQAGAVVGLANIATNHVELLAWTDPAAAIQAAPSAIEAQQDLAAQHELGKTYTAVAIARMRLNNLGGAADEFDTACTYLERAGYRSGRARAELFRGFLHYRRTDLDRAADSMRWAAAELVASEVYPTLILLVEQALARLELPDQGVAQVADEARKQIEPLDSLEQLEQRIWNLVEVLLEEGS